MIDFLILNILLKVDLAKCKKQIGLMDFLLNGMMKNKIGKGIMKICL
jgi:hypothetical protein